MKPQIAAFSTALALAFAASAAQAEQVCMNAGEMEASLIDWYGETPVSAPNADSEQIWASEHTGTWTMVKLLSDGNACVIAQGEDWMGGLAEEEMLAALND